MNETVLAPNIETSPKSKATSSIGEPSRIPKPLGLSA
jgi:hypothetical protein